MSILNSLTVEQKSTYTAILLTLIGVVMFSVGFGLNIHLAVNLFLIIGGLITGAGGIAWFGSMAESGKLKIFKEG